MDQKAQGRAVAARLMLAFADRTGLQGSGPPRRYLWTDAFAVCNFLGLWRASGEDRFLDLALRLVAQVHHVLGRHRSDDARSGWLSGLSEEDGARHPTTSGLRIGKPLPERAPGEEQDEQLEWQQDGQYFHYLTRWMHALDQVSRVTGDGQFTRQAVELGEAAHRAFVHRAGPGSRRMYWKMSVDLSRPLVASMGHHDPLDGLVTCLQIGRTAARLAPESGSGLAAAEADFAGMLEVRRMATSDPLGTGGLLGDAHRLLQLERDGVVLPDQSLPEHLLRGALLGLRSALANGQLRGPAARRLAFRELGLAIGLTAVAEMLRSPTTPAVRAVLEQLSEHLEVRERIHAFWLEPGPRDQPTWLDHADINDVMLATSLSPDGYLELQVPAGR